ncbi:MAG: hypothetical protein M3374_04720 [Pseudomonadota bacterium]|nr:hypothetical protein [Pseudomonadota bacterium]
MSGRPHGTSLLRRGELGFWFCGLGVLGLMRAYLAAFRGGGFAADAVTWLWLGGSALVTVIGVALVVRALQQGR